MAFSFQVMRVVLFAFGVLLLLTGACTADNTSADELYAAGINAYLNGSYEHAGDLFNQSMLVYDLRGDADNARKAFGMRNRASWILIEMMLNRTQAEEVLAQGLSELSEAERSNILKPGESIQTESDGQTRYFYDVANNAAYHNTTIMQEISRKANHSPFFDEVFPLITNNTSFDGWYGNPHTFIANSSISLPRELLPANGTLKVWVPLPIKTDSQKDIRILNLQPEQYIVSGPVTDGDLGQVYYEIPLSEMDGPFINISADYEFTTSERRFIIDQNSIAPYDTSSDLYRDYTQTQPNIEVNPGIKNISRSIIGDEQNPYRKARLIYDYIIRTYPYSTVPHTYLVGSQTPESTYMFDTGFGDCGTQSMLFAALCRAAGIPARSAGGYQLAPGLAGPHFWAEFYLPGYGWIPADVTIAESADWAFDKSDADREKFKDYYFGNMDPYRYTIQNDVDISFTPDPGNDIIMNMVHQTPALVCHESREDIEMLGMQYWNITLSEVGQPGRADMTE